MDTIDVKKLEQLLSDVDLLHEHQQEINRVKGEHFNIFSVLKMESKENATHSAFLGELLSPKGSHLFKGVFLDHFFDHCLTEIPKDKFDTTTAVVTLEKYIGVVNLEEKTGGRIDIYISDAKGNSISIENKIYAVDQKAQIQRYVNHNKEKNTVYYLTLDGGLPSEGSAGNLENGTKYHCISYKRTIIEWLTNCMKEAAEQPILRESIKQYILLIKKLTNQLSDSIMEEKVVSAIERNYIASKIIADNIWQAELKVTKVFLAELMEKIQTEFEDCKMTLDEDLTDTWKGLSLTFEEWEGIEVRLEGQSKITWYDTIYGIRASEGDWDRVEFKSKLSEVELLQSGFSSSDYWPYYQTILKFGQPSEREKLFDPTTRLVLVDNTAEKLIELVKLCHEDLSEIKKK